MNRRVLQLWLSVLSLTLFALAGVAMTLSGGATLAQTDDAKATIDAFVSSAFTQTAQAGSQPNMTETLAAAFSAAQTATQAARATPTPAPTATPVPFNADALQVISQNTLDMLAGPTGTGAYLSPDGTRFAYIGRDGFCTYSLDGTRQGCTQVSGEAQERLVRRPDLEAISWSPDAKWLVITQRSLVDFVDSDIWIMNADTGELINLTDDEFEGRIPLGEQGAKPFWLDLAPRWSSDSTRIAFIRYASEQEITSPVAYAVSIDTGVAEELGSLSSLGGFPSYALAWSPDGMTLAYNLWDRNGAGRNSRNSGAWFFNIDGEGSSQVAVTDPQRVPFALDFSPDGGFLMMFNDADWGAFGSRAKPEPDISPVRLLSLADGGVLLVDDMLIATGAGWSPSGSALAYLVRDMLNEEQSGLYIKSEPGKPGRLVLQGMFSVPTPRLLKPLVWANNNTILLSLSPAKGIVIVTLG